MSQETKTSPGLEVENIDKRFVETVALQQVSFRVERKEIFAVLGPSGCGKSTLLSIIAGLEKPDHGYVAWGGQNLEGVPPHRRNFGLMFQDLALFPHRNVFQNVAFGLQMAALPNLEIKERVRDVLTMVGLPGFESRDVNTLSGGESQRVALARSLAPEPRLLMLDEPLGSLDRNLRERLVLDLRRILKESQQTAIYVTHDQEEAFSIADCVVVMNSGKIVQIGAPQEIYRKPTSPFVARFLGLKNLVSGEIHQGKKGLELVTPVGNFPVDNPYQGKVTVLIRPDSVQLNSSNEHQIVGIVCETTFRGNSCQAVIQVGQIRLIFEFPSSTHLPQIGESVTLSFDPRAALQIFPEIDVT